MTSTLSLAFLVYMLSFVLRSRALLSLPPSMPGALGPHQRGCPALLCAARDAASKKASKTGAPKLQRLERIVANRGVGSRKEVASLFKQGLVRVAGEVVRSGADKYPQDTLVEIEGYGDVNAVPLLAVFHKPTGVISSMRDDWGRASLEELQVRRSPSHKPNHNP